MYFFDFHHHNPKKKGIYNSHLLEENMQNFFSVGLHPMELDRIDENAIKWFREKSLHPSCLAIGECGLDHRFANQVYQEEIFTMQIEWANQIQKPVIIHCVRLFHRLGYFKKRAKTSHIVHGFHKKASIGENLIEMGFYLSFGKALLEDVSLQTFFKKVPHNQFFLETDNSDASIEEIYDKASELKGIKMETLDEIVQHNLEDIQRYG